MSEDTVQALVVALLGTGGATFIWTVVKSIIAYKNSAEGREDKAIARLEKFEETCREQLTWEREMGAYWVRVAGIYAHALAVNGIKEPPLPVRPPEGFVRSPYDPPLPEKMLPERED